MVVQHVRVLLKLFIHLLFLYVVTVSDRVQKHLKKAICQLSLVFFSLTADTWVSN